MRPHWLRVRRNVSGWCLCGRKERGTETQTEETRPGRRPREDQGQDWGGASTSQGTSRAVSQPSSSEERGRPSLRASEGPNPAHTLTSGSWPPETERTDFCFSSHPGRGTCSSASPSGARPAGSLRHTSGWIQGAELSAPRRGWHTVTL